MTSLFRLRTTLTLTAILLAGLVTVFGNAIPAEAHNAHWIEDATGATLDMGQDAQRIVSLAPNLTEMVCAMGLRDKLAGRTDYCNYPPDVEELPTVGGFVDTSLERIIALQPDLVLAYQGNSLELVEQLRTAGITVMALTEPESVLGIYYQMQSVWEVAGDDPDTTPPQLEAFHSTVNAYLSKLASSSAATADAKPVVFFGYPGENTLTCGGGSFLDDLISLSGGTNAAHDVDGRWPLVSAEFLVTTNPDWIISATPCTGTNDLAQAKQDLLAELRQDAVWRNLAAVQQGNVVVLDADILLRPGPRIVDALSQLAAAFKPIKTEAAGG